MKTTTLKQSVKTEPTIVKRPAGERGQTELGWLHSRHTFSFGNYFDPDHMGFRSLRVINDNVVEVGQAARPNELTLLFAGAPRGDAVGIRADAEIFFGKLDAKRRLVHRSGQGRAQWLQVIHGEVSVSGETLKTGDGAAIENTEALEIQSREGAQFLLFDLK